MSFNIVARNRELIERLRTDADEQERLLHVCDSTINARKAAEVLEEMTDELERRDKLLRENMNGRLKPCPICGSVAVRSIEPRGTNPEYPTFHVLVHCTGYCGCKIEFDYIAPPWTRNPRGEAWRQGAIRWNRRVWE